MLRRRLIFGAERVIQPDNRGKETILPSLRMNQQIIVFIIFVLLFASFSLFLPGFFTTQNILTLVRSVSVLGILGLGMAIVVIGRGIDLSMMAMLAIPSGLVLQMLQVGLRVRCCTKHASSFLMSRLRP